jgi:hypothetical protein
LISALLATLLSNTPAPPSCPCWLPALTLAGPALRVLYGLPWPAAGRPVFVSLNERAAPPPGGLAPARGPRLAAAHSGPVSPGRISAPRARGAAAGRGSPGARPAPHLSTFLACVPGSCSPTRRAVFSVERRVRGPTGPAAPPSKVLLPSPAWGREGGRVPLHGLHSDGPSPWGLREDVSSPRPLCARGAALVAHSYHPSWDKQESTNEASSLTHCVLASRARVRSVRVESVHSPKVIAQFETHCESIVY